MSRAGRQLAEEITSEVFMIAWGRLAELPPDGSVIRPQVLRPGHKLARDRCIRFAVRRGKLIGWGPFGRQPCAVQGTVYVGREYPGQVDLWNLNVRSGWTNDGPPLPPPARRFKV